MTSGFCHSKNFPYNFHIFRVLNTRWRSHRVLHIYSAKKKKGNGQKLMGGYGVTSYFCHINAFSTYFPYLLSYYILYVNQITYYMSILQKYWSQELMKWDCINNCDQSRQLSRIVHLHLEVWSGLVFWPFWA